MVIHPVHTASIQILNKSGWTHRKDQDMKEHNYKKINVLGIDVSVMRPEKAAILSMDLIKNRGLHRVFFLSAGGSLFCQNNAWAEELVQASDIVLTGDRHTEMATAHQPYSQSEDDDPGRFADEYFKKLFHRLNREYREIFAVMETSEYLEAFQDYLKEQYPGISFQGIVYEGETDAEFGKVVNEINALIPDVVLFCLPVEQQLLFVRDYFTMMNTRLCICIESMHTLLHKMIGFIPGWVSALHLESLYHRFTGTRKIQDFIIGSIFKKKVMDDSGSEFQQDISREDIQEPEVPEEKKED